MAKKIRIDVPEEQGKTSNSNTTTKFKYVVGFLILLVLVLVVALIITLISRNNNDNNSNNDSNVSDIKGEDSRTEDTKKYEKDTPVVHLVTCTNPKSNFQGYPFSMEFEYNGNDFSKYYFVFFVDKGKELSEDVLNDYVERYEDKMPWTPDEKGFALDDYNNPYKYSIFYGLSAENYCKSLDGCDEVQLEFSRVNEMLVDFQEQLNVKCTIH